MALTKIILDRQSDLILSNPTITLASGQNLNVALSAETSSRISGDLSVSNSLSTEIARASSAEASLNTKVSDETVRAESAETSLNAKVSTETVRAVSAESSLDVNLSAELSNRIAGDLSLQNQIDFIKSNVAPEAIDSLTEYFPLDFSSITARIVKS